MNLKEYIKSQITPQKQVDLELIYQELINFGYKPQEIFVAINAQIKENIEAIIEDYKKKKNE